ncbi:MAG: HWE histidine kinase domain-containing protein [Pseudomonadota bacterium]|nr:HWE histidine kinase domain-containing protein [Pseudomonadota bacterium]
MTQIRRSRPPRILMLEDSRLDAELIREHLETITPQPVLHHATNRREYVEALEAPDFDVILADFSLPDFDGMSALEMAREAVPEVPFIFVSGILGEEVAIESFRRGATDYVLKQRLIRLPAAVERALAEARERVERRRAENQKELLVRELSHRVKNTMAVVMSLVRRTVKTSDNVDDYVDNLLGRLRAMADAHALLFETNWSEAELLEVIRRTIAPQDRNGTRIKLEPGTLTMLPPKAALALGMVLNELATNAVKHGALSNDHGVVKISWDRSAADVVAIRWQEIDGPAVRVPEDKGFGATLIDRSIRYELEGDVTLHYNPTGLVCDITFPLSAAE